MFALRSRAFPLVAVAAVLASSCAKEARTPVHPVHGQVLFEGRPVPNALVVFHPTSDPAVGATLGKPHAIADHDGFFTLGTYGRVVAGRPGGGIPRKQQHAHQPPARPLRQPRDLAPDRPCRRRR